jgi:hypothetical protein
MNQNVRKNGVVIVSNNAQSETYPLLGKSPTFYITNQFCRVRYIERLLYDFFQVTHVFHPCFDDISAICWPILMQNNTLER